MMKECNQRYFLHSWWDLNTVRITDQKKLEVDSELDEERVKRVKEVDQ